ncbi:hypothetical protein D7Z54_15905 [Salibacterium salarium]|uniref:Uncharacterized protein n=1 Tax=Salibacterium salarium TaxID=284579 RepID=A0A428N246_9BACI|nr:hypothetical protein D7Z54_15905 [Salibacterium salarium]
MLQRVSYITFIITVCSFLIILLWSFYEPFNRNLLREISIFIGMPMSFYSFWSHPFTIITYILAPIWIMNLLLLFIYMPRLPHWIFGIMNIFTFISLTGWIMFMYVLWSLQAQ